MEEHKEGYFYFASESVGEGHPDKLCDQVSDGVLDACLAVDPNAKVAIETATKGNMVSSVNFCFICLLLYETLQKKLGRIWRKVIP